MIDVLFQLIEAIVALAFVLFVFSQAWGLLMGLIMGVATVVYVLAVSAKEALFGNR